MLKGIILIYAIWGFNWVVMKTANTYFPPITFACYRFIVGSLVLLSVCAIRRLPLPPRPFWKYIIISGLLQISINMGMIQSSMQTVSAGLGAILNYTMAMWVAILAHFFLGESLTVRKIGGIAISIAGLCVVMNASLSGDLRGFLLGIGSAIAWASSAVIIKYQNKKFQGKNCNMVQYTAWQMVIGMMGLALYAAFVEGGSVHWTPIAVGTVLYNGVLASAVAYFLWNWLLTRLDASIASVTILGVPAVGVLCGVIFLGESMTMLSALGMVMTLLGIFIIVKQKRGM